MNKAAICTLNDMISDLRQQKCLLLLAIEETEKITDTATADNNYEQDNLLACEYADRADVMCSLLCAITNKANSVIDSIQRIIQREQSEATPTTTA